MIRIGFLALSACIVAGVAVAASNDPPPPWAFPVNSAGETPDTGNPKDVLHVPGSQMSYTRAQSNDFNFFIDWFPREHPTAPVIVAIGHKAQKILACSACHGAVGAGGAESAALTGLRANYIIEQVAEFKSGRRKAAEPKMIPPHGMEYEANKVSLDDVKAAAAYFAQLTFAPRNHVIETDTVPKTTVKDVGVLVKVPGGGTEPLGHRVIELPSDLRQWELGNPHAQYTVYVPKGSIARGAALVASGDGAVPCATCHGAKLEGTSIAPPLAGRSASYVVRQLYDIQYGTRQGPTVALMKPEVAHMAADDRIAVAAYIASLKP